MMSQVNTRKDTSFNTKTRQVQCRISKQGFDLVEELRKEIYRKTGAMPTRSRVLSGIFELGILPFLRKNGMNEAADAYENVRA